MATWRRVLVCAALLACVAPACSSGGGGGGIEGSGDASVLGMLELVPASGGYGDYVQIALYDRAAAQAGLDKPSDSDSRAVLEYLNSITGGKASKVYAPVSDMVRLPVVQLKDSTDAVGFNGADMAGDVTAGNPPDVITAARGGFDEKKIDAALHGDQWSDSVETKKHDGVSYFSWLDDNEANADVPNPLSRIGGSGRLAVVDGVLCYARNDDAIGNAIDTRKGKAGSLAGEADFKDAANVLDDHDVYGAFLVGDTSQYTADSASSDAIGDAEVLANYDLLALGQARENDTNLVVMVLVNPDDDTAKDNADRLEKLVTDGKEVKTDRPFSDTLEVRSVEAHGRLTIGLFETSETQFYTRVIVANSNLAWHD